MAITMWGQKILNYEKIDPDELSEKIRQGFIEEEERKQRELKIEANRINDLQCPACKSTEKKLFTQAESNGIIGPGCFSHIINEYYICQSCGIHFSDLQKKKKNN